MTAADKLRSVVRQSRCVPQAVALAWAAAKPWMSAWVLLQVMGGVLPAVGVYLTSPLVDAVLRREARAGLEYAAVIAAALLGGEVVRAASGWVRTNLAERVQDHIMDLVHRKSVELDLSFYDSAEFFDRMHRARVEASYRPVAMIESLGSVFENGITLAAMAGILLSFGWWVPAALCLGTAPALWVVVRYAVRQHEFHLRTTEDERRTWYFDWLMTARETAPELRLFGLGEYFRGKYRELREGLRAERTGLARDHAWAQFMASAAALGVGGASLLWMLWRALAGAATLGSLAMFYQAFQQGSKLMRTLLDGVGELYYNSLFLGNLFAFLALEARVKDAAEAEAAPSELREGIRFEGVTFRYPGAVSAVVRGLDLTIPAGKLAAFVGPNGAGKSTFIKLLCRFYDPEEGRVLLDGVDVRRMRAEDLRSRITVLFQEPVRYNASVRENIGLGGVGDVRVAVAAAGAEEIVAQLPDGFDNVLGKMFVEGAELSAGQWQRIALARAFYRRAPILLLDEPTSAMDPWAEADWLGRLRVLARGCTAILITHRFTTAMRADVIYVMADGQVVESGSHEELLANGGLYAQSWREQTESRGAAVA